MPLMLECILSSLSGGYLKYPNSSTLTARSILQKVINLYYFLSDGGGLAHEGPPSLI
jgi:hypothetical protein